jgi:hypothetical protein
MQRTLLTGAAIAALALTSTAATASADSIAYVKGGDVWLTTPDGARQYQVTSTGGYTDVSQADDGTMIALNGIRLRRLARDGQVLADFATPVSDSRPAGSRTFWGPYDPAISPDGTKVAYTYYYTSTSQAPGCTPPECVTVDTQGGTAYSHADRATDWDEPGLGRHSGWRNPAWIDNDNVMISDPTRLPNADVLVDTIGDTGVPIKEWFTDNGTTHISGGDVTRGQTKLAFVAGDGDSELRIYKTAPYPAYPDACYRYSDAAGGRFSTPTFSPDGAHLAWSEGDGVKVVTVPDFAGGCTTTGASPKATMIVPGGSNPDWGPADVPAPRTTPSSGGSAGAGGGTGAGGSAGGGAATGGSSGGSVLAGGSGTPQGSTGTPTTTPAISVSAGRLRAVLSGGLTVHLTGFTAATYEVVAKHGKTTVAKGQVKVGGSGSATGRLTFTKAAKRSLRRTKQVRLTVAAATASTQVTVKR